MLFCVGNFSLSPELTATRGICLASKVSILWLGTSFLFDFFAAKSFIGLPVIKDQILKELLQTASMEVLDEHNIFGFPYPQPNNFGLTEGRVEENNWNSSSGSQPKKVRGGGTMGK